jgi:hypothetical protein
MKRADKKSLTDRDFDELISKFSENEVLNVFAMQCVRGGGEPTDGGGDTILFPPKPPHP